MEHIWVMPFADGARGQVLNYNAPKLSSDAQSAVNGHLPHYAGGSSNGHLCVSPALVYAYDKDDAFIIKTGKDENKKPIYRHVTFDDFRNEVTTMVKGSGR